MKTTRERGFTRTSKFFGVSCQRQGGFTILELLVVLAVIGVLSSVIIVLTGNIRKDSRDARRMSDMREIHKALILYADNNRTFPIATTLTPITGTDAVSTILEASGVVSEIPIDPQHPTYTYSYQSDASGSTFTVSLPLKMHKLTPLKW